MDDEIEKLKHQLGVFIKFVLQDKNETMTQAEIAKQCKLTQPKTSYLLKLKLDDFAVERLLNIINLLGYDIDIKITESNNPKGSIIFHVN